MQEQGRRCRYVGGTAITAPALGQPRGFPCRVLCKGILGAYLFYGRIRFDVEQFDAAGEMRRKRFDGHWVLPGRLAAPGQLI